MLINKQYPHLQENHLDHTYMLQFVYFCNLKRRLSSFIKTDQDLTWHTYWPTDRTTDRHMDRPTERPTDRPTDRPKDRPMDRPTDRPMDRPKDRPS